MMVRYQYKVVPAPASARKIRGVRGAKERFALTLEEVMNVNGLEGWEFVSAETLSCIEKGWFRSSTEDQTVLVFRRALDEAEPVARSTAPALTERSAPSRVAALSARDEGPRSASLGPALRDAPERLVATPAIR